MIDIDLDMIKKYDRPGPRYTSYPTAPHFHEEFNESKFLSGSHSIFIHKLYSGFKPCRVCYEI